MIKWLVSKEQLVPPWKLSSGLNYVGRRLSTGMLLTKMLRVVTDSLLRILVSSLRPNSK